MPRARNLKPGFFTNDRLAECDPLARLLFAGLWTIADREGRLEDRPRKIKAELLPYDDCEAEALLAQLADRGFIVRYDGNGTPLIQVVNFGKHQAPHVKEAASQLPGPGGHSASTMQAPDEHGEKIPSSLIPSSLIADTGLPLVGVAGAAAPDRSPPREAHPIPQNFEITDDDANEGLKRGVPVDDIGEEWQKFHDYYLARQNEQRTDWHAQWRSWLDKRSKFPPRASPNGIQGNRTSAAAATADAFQRIARGD
jgi:hypothetical protein